MDHKSVVTLGQTGYEYKFLEIFPATPKVEYEQFALSVRIATCGIVPAVFYLREGGAVPLAIVLVQMQQQFHLYEGRHRVY